MFISIIILLTCLLIQNVSSYTYAQSINQASATWSSTSINQLKSYNFLDSNTFKNLYANITREDFIYLMVNVCELIQDDYILPTTTTNYKDTNNIYVDKATYIGLTEGVGNGYFAPDEYLTREQMATYYAKIWQLYDMDFLDETDARYNDDDQISDWARASVYKALSNNVMSGKGKNFFYPKETVTREEALVFTNNLIQLLISEYVEQGEAPNRRLTVLLDNQINHPMTVPESEYEKSILIAHGGGEIFDLTVTNTLEAINQSLAKGYLLIEIDLLKTKDNHYILAHDWSIADNYFNLPYGLITLDQFKKASANYPFSQMDLEDLIYLIEKNPNFKIITDTKDDNLELLSYISRKYPNYLERFIPQIYDMNEYDPVKRMGFNEIIYSLYKIYKTDWEVTQFAQKHKLFGVTMAESRVNANFCNLLNRYNIRSYVHTVNDFEHLFYYREMGISGVYTDRLN